MVNGRNKGKAGEREVVNYLQPMVDMVCGAGVHTLERNLSQTRGGGHDIGGLPWLALEVKRQESAFQVGWWHQTMEQALKLGLASGLWPEPVLLWRRNRQPWRARVLAPVVIGQWASPALVIDLECRQFEKWFMMRLRWHKEHGDEPWDQDRWWGQQDV